MALLLTQNYETSSNGKYLLFDFIFTDQFGYKDYKDINFFDEFGVYISDVDRGWMQIYSNMNSAFSLLLFDSWPLADDILSSMNFVGSHIFDNFRRIDEGLYQRTEDACWIYEIGIDLRAMRVRRIGKIGENLCNVRIKMIWRKI